jgi:hypothetical protein
VHAQKFSHQRHDRQAAYAALAARPNLLIQARLISKKQDGLISKKQVGQTSFDRLLMEKVVMSDPEFKLR